MNATNFRAPLRRALAVVAAAALAAPAVSTAATLHVDDFTAAGTSSWTGGAFGGGLPTRQSSGGPGGAGDAYLQVATTVNHLATYNSSSAWTGSFAAVDAGVVRLDMRNAPGSDPLQMRLVLFGPGSTNVRWNSTAAHTVPADGDWHNYEFSLAEESLTRVAGVGTYADLMNGVVRFMLRHNPTPSATGVNVTATLGLDNIELAAAAPPTSPADFNGDLTVDDVDLGVWAAAYGLTDAGDATGDGLSTGADFLVWQQERVFGAIGAVPEPQSLVLAALAATALAFVPSRTATRSVTAAA